MNGTVAELGAVGHFYCITRHRIQECVSGGLGCRGGRLCVRDSFGRNVYIFDTLVFVGCVTIAEHCLWHYFNHTLEFRRTKFPLRFKA